MHHNGWKKLDPFLEYHIASPIVVVAGLTGAARWMSAASPHCSLSSVNLSLGSTRQPET
jgi:hypothetical protein